MKKKIIIIAIVVIIIAIVLFQIFSKDSGENLDLFTVERGTVSSEITETGQVQKGDKINLAFRNSGEVSNIYIEAGDEVSKGETLMKLDTASLALQLKEAETALEISQINLNKLMAGPVAEQIQIYQTAVNNREVALAAAQQTLIGANENALNTVDSAYLKAYNAYAFVDYLENTYFTVPDQGGLKVKENKALINSAVSVIQSVKGSVNSDSDQDNINSLLSNVSTRLSDISLALSSVRQVTESAEYKNIVSSTDKTTLDTHQSYINTVITTLNNNEQAIDVAEISVETAAGNLLAAQNDLELLIAAPRDEDVDLYQNQVLQAKTNVEALNKQISDSYLKSPVAGQVAVVNKRVGELAQASGQDVAVTILPNVPYQIEVNIYEEDVVNIKVGNPVDITLVAFPDDEFSGSVVSIDPAEKIIDGVVYYKTIVGFNEVPDGVKSGMTTDVVIRPNVKENVLYIPQEAILEKDGSITVQVFKDGKTEGRIVELGLEGDDYIEIISGLQEGEQVVID